MTVQNFLENANLQSLLIVFFNITKEEEKEFIISSRYVYSKFTDIELNSKLRNEINDLLISWSKLNFEVRDSMHILKIKKVEKGYNLENFIEDIYNKIQKRIVIEDLPSKEIERKIISALFILRGSADFTTKLYAVDIPKILSNDYYYEKLLKVMINVSSIEEFNFNFRELQRDFTQNNKKRNSQIRVGLSWFNENYIEILKNTNIYKYDILISNQNKILTKTVIKGQSFEFLTRILFYKSNILNKLTDEEKNKMLDIRIQELREALGFTTGEENKINRAAKIKLLVDMSEPDECVSCKGIYETEDRTFKKRNRERYYFEIHHVIAFSSDKKADQFDNLVKLCPACHRALTPNRAEEKYQKEIIRRILLNSDKARNYVENYFDEYDNDKVIDYVYSMLR